MPYRYYSTFFSATFLLQNLLEQENIPQTQNDDQNQKEHVMKPSIGPITGQRHLRK